MAESLTHQVYKVNQVQAHESDAAQSIGITLYQLMERAGAAVFAEISQSYGSINHLLVISGKGNNGGDGYVIARLAYQAGLKVDVIVNAPRHLIKGDADAALVALEQTNVPIHFCQQTEQALPIIACFNGELIVDCLFGIGLNGILSMPDVHLIKQINAKLCHRLSVDVPSGLDANTGLAAPIAVQADTTVTLIVYKNGTLTGQAANYVGKLVLATLGVSDEFAKIVPTTVYCQTVNELIPLPKRLASSHKGSIGRLLAVGGYANYSGAAYLCSEAALRSGASLVGVCCDIRSRDILLAKRPELMIIADSAQTLEESDYFEQSKVMVLGPGLGQQLWSKALFELCIMHNVRKVVDADALRLLAKTEQYDSDWILTPHPGEAAALLSCNTADIEADRYSSVIKIAQQYGGICVLKGAGTLISDGQTVWVNTSGNAGMASGGMGDVLSGVIGALMLQMPNLIDAARLGVYIHGRAADIIACRNGQIGMLASDLFIEIQRLINNHYL